MDKNTHSASMRTQVRIPSSHGKDRHDFTGMVTRACNSRIVEYVWTGPEAGMPAILLSPPLTALMLQVLVTTPSFLCEVWGLPPRLSRPSLSLPSKASSPPPAPRLIALMEMCYCLPWLMLVVFCQDTGLVVNRMGPFWKASLEVGASHRQGTGMLMQRFRAPRAVRHVSESPPDGVSHPFVLTF